MKNQDFVEDDLKPLLASDSLGIIAKIVSPPSFLEQDRTVMRYYLQSQARRLIPEERVAVCCRSLAPNSQTVEIHHIPKSKSAHYKGLLNCGRLWQCAVCATKISERRAAELLEAVTAWHLCGGFVVLITFTLSHSKADTLPDLLEGLIEASRAFKQGREWEKFVADYLWAGSVKALEVTYGVNGWHPHLHQLVFVEPMSQIRFKAFVEDIKKRWSQMIAKQGFYASFEHGADVRETDSAVYDYVAKFGRLPKLAQWTIERELAKASVKTASKDGKTPNELLLAYGAGDAEAGRLWVIYMRAFKRKNQLTWSRGLRAFLGLSDVVSDTEAAEEVPSESVLLATLTRDQWKHLIGLSSDLRGYVLAIAAQGDKTALTAFLARYGVEVGESS